MVWGALGATVDVKVIELDSGKPIADAEVTVSAAVQRGGPSVTCASDADGTARLDFEGPPGDMRIGVVKTGWCPLRWDLSASDFASRTSFQFRMAPAMTVGGVVHDDRGKPVPGVKIAFNFPQSLSGPRTPLDDLFVISDAGGKWRADFIAADADSIQLDVMHPSYKWDRQQPSLADLKAQKAVLIVQGLNQITGRVLGPDGHPVAGATVFKGGEYGIMVHSPQTVETTTDADGHFQFPPGDSGKIQVAACAAGFGPALVASDVSSDTKPVELMLTEPHILRVRVTDLDGHPLAGVSVRADSWKSLRYPPWTFTTDADGRFTFTNSPAETVSMDFLAQGRMNMIMYPLDPGKEENVVQLCPELRLHGRVLDAATQQPVASVTITPGFPREVFQNGVLTNSGGQFPAMGRDRVFHNGTYDWTFKQPMVVGGNKPYDFVLRAEADGYGPEISRVFKATEGDAEYDFQLKPAAYLTNVVRLPDGSPAANAKIYLLDAPWSLQAVNGMPRTGPMGGMGDVSTLTADADGRFKVMDPPLQPTLVVWHDAGFALLQTADLRSSPEIKLTRWSRIEGTIKRGSAVAANEEVALWYPQQLVAVHGATPRGNGTSYEEKPVPFHEHNTRADAKGHFVFEHVTPGEVAIARVEGVPRNVGIGMPIESVWGGCRLAVIRLPEGTSTNIEVGGFGRTVTGRFVSTNQFESCLVSLAPDLPPVPYMPGLPDDTEEKLAQEWFWSDAAAPLRIWLGGTPQRGGGFGTRQSNFAGVPGEGSWAVKVEDDGSFRIDDVPGGRIHPPRRLLQARRHGPELPATCRDFAHQPQVHHSRGEKPARQTAARPRSNPRNSGKRLFRPAQPECPRADSLRARQSGDGVHLATNGCGWCF